HLVQRGPSFPKPVEVSIDAGTGQVTVRYRDDEGREKVLDERLDLPADVSNGLILTVLKNLRPDDPSATVSMVIATPKPRLVKMVITRVGEDPVSNGRTTGRAARYVVQVGGLAGVVAPLTGKATQTEVWMLHGDAPAFLRSEGPLFYGGPVWRMELAVPG